MAEKRQFLFVRHGETVGNSEKIAHGQTESPLNERGVRQAQATAAMLRDWNTRYHRVYASPMSRARDTGEHIAQSLELPLDTHDGLMEGFLGDWEGITYAELDEVGFARHSIKDDDFSGHNGESPNTLADRMANAIAEIKARHPDENIIFVSHGAAIAHLLARLMGTAPAFGYQYLMHNAAVAEISVDGEGAQPELLALNVHDHLPAELRADPHRGDNAVKPSLGFPKSLDELTTQWLLETLAPYTGDATLTGFSTERIGVGEGFMGQLARVTLSYAEETTHAPASIVAKFAATRADTREMARDQNLYRREIGFYQDIGQDVGIRVPVCYYCNFDETTQHFAMLLEDMVPGEASDQVVGTSKATSRQVIEEFARLHAKWWNNANLDDYDWAKWIVNEMPMDEASARLKANIEEVLSNGSFDDYPEMKRLMPLLPPLLRIEPASPYPFTLAHGDLRSDNIIQATAQGGEFCVLDWQLSGKADPANDIARWLAQSISIEDRRETEQELLKLYHDKLIENGVTGYSYKTFINAYKMNLIVILVMFSMSIEGVDRSSDRAKALFHQFYSRLDATLADWELEGLLKVVPLMAPFIKFSTWLKALFGRKRSA